MQEGSRQGQSTVQECTDAICVTVDATRVDVYMGDRFWSAYAHMSAVA